MSIPNYLYALANHKDPATVTAGGMSIPVKIMDIDHESKWGESDKCTFKCLVVNEDQIRFSGFTVNEDIAQAMRNVAKNALNSVYGTRCKKAANPFEIKKVYFNDPVTVVLWADGTKTIVRCQDGDVYSKETGLALCIAKKALGNKGNFNDVFHKWIPEEDVEVTWKETDGCPYCRCATRTDKTFEVRTPGGSVVDVQFNWCPVCGREIPKGEDESNDPV